MPTADDLRALLRRIDGRGYKAYSDVRGRHVFDGLTIFVDHVQSDPFAAPSKLRLRVPMDVAALPEELWRTTVRRRALADYLARAVRAAAPAPGGPERRGGRRGQDGERGAGSGKSGRISIDAGGQEVLERTAALVTPDFVEARIEVGLPAAGRRVLGREAEALLCDRLPEIAARALEWEHLDGERAREHVEVVENQEHIRDELERRGLVAFVANGAILPRESGASERPMAASEARPFSAPASLCVEMPLVNPLRGERAGATTISGMGIPRGVTLIVGGGYHGKSTLLQALERCVFPHVPGDGREYVVSTRDLVKIRAEDGRSVTGVDIHAFIDHLPSFGRPSGEDDRERTRRFSTDDASGSTSQAASIAEAVEAGATGLLLDEDTSATNFMLRDARMQRLVHRDHEPITPFVDRVRELDAALGVSTIVVMGGCGDYFDVADTVIRMRDYRPEDATAEARAIAAETGERRERECASALEPFAPRVPIAGSFVASRGRRDVKISTKSRELVLYGREPVDLRYVTQLVDASQTRAAALAVHLASQRWMAAADDAGPTLAEVLDRIEALLDEEGLDVLDPWRRGDDDERHPGALARPRRHEIAAAINRMRTLRVA